MRDLHLKSVIRYEQEKYANFNKGNTRSTLAILNKYSAFFQINPSLSASALKLGLARHRVG